MSSLTELTKDVKKFFHGLYKTFSDSFVMIIALVLMTFDILKGIIFLIIFIYVCWSIMSIPIDSLSNTSAIIVIPIIIAQFILYGLLSGFIIAIVVFCIYLIFSMLLSNDYKITLNL